MSRNRVIIDLKPRTPPIRWPRLYREAAAILDAMTAGKPCRATDGASLVGDGPDDLREPQGRCTLDAGHDGDWHQEWRAGRLWSEWRGPHPGQRCGICHRDGAEH